MTITSTPNDIIRFVYNEVSLEERKEIQNALLWDNALAEYYHEVVAMKRAASKVKREPSDKAIQNILNFSKSLPSCKANYSLNTRP